MNISTTPVEQISYKAAIDELQGIVAMMQDANCDVDNLTAYTRRAAALIAECRRRLTQAEAELNPIIASINNGGDE